MDRAISFLKRYKNPIIGIACLVVPAFLFLFPHGPGLYLLTVMSLLWALAPISIYVTAFLPLILVPLLRIATANEVSRFYWNDAIVLFLGSFVLSLACEKVSLHTRLAISVISLIGKSAVFLLLNIMLLTAFLSMWMSNSATAALMVPLAETIITELERKEETQDMELGPVEGNEDSIDGEEREFADDSNVLQSRNNSREKDEAIQVFGKFLLIAVAFSANLGGIGTLVGTGPNVSLVAMLDVLYGIPGVSFFKWMLYAVPVTIICLVILWALLVGIFIGPKRLRHVKFDVEEYKRKKEELGKIRFEEWAVLVCFGLCGIFWITRIMFPPFVYGWSSVFFDSKVGDGTVAIFFGVLLFIVPVMDGKPVLEVADIAKLHWHLLVLLGGGFAVAFSLLKSGVTDFVGQSLQSSLEGVPSLVVVIVICMITGLWTNVSSNVATSNIMIPLVGALAISVGENPLLFVLPVTLCCSLAFLLPTATPPNAICLTSGRVEVKDMLKIGVVINVTCLLFVALWSYFVGRHIFGIELGVVPSWANQTQHN